jgi:hypothetical protein
MARRGRSKPEQPARRRVPQPLPPPLPPAERTVGQLIAETVRFYQGHFFQVLPLGLSVAALTQLTTAFGTRHIKPRGHPPARSLHDPTSLLGGGFETTIVLSSLLLTASFIVAVVLVTGARPDGRRISIAYGTGVLVFLPAPLIVGLLGPLALPALVYLAFIGWVVPVILVEGTGFRASFGRAARLGRADYVHALGGLAALVVVFAVIRIMLVLLIRTGGEIGARSTSALADLVLSPTLFVGTALLYIDQVARAEARK